MLKIILLLSRKTTIEVADLRQFETQATCLSLPQPKLLNNDYDFSNCTDIDIKDATKEEENILLKRTQTFMGELGNCAVQYLWSWISSYTG